MIARAAIFISALASFPAAGAPVLEHPIDCELGESCYIQNYVDVDPTQKSTDFACGHLTYDGHKGTDFALPTLADMQRGVTVRAAAEGVVAGTRDGVTDAVYSEAAEAGVKGRECGNGVAIDHGEGWTTQYCHMKKGSISVSNGQMIKAGTPLGQVGLSGKTQFPHLHISVRHNDQIVDPFAPSGPDTSCNPDYSETLWIEAPEYTAGGLVRLGFDTKVPAFADIKSGAAGYTTLPADAPALVLFAQAFGSQKGDIVTITITGPNGFAFEHKATIEKPQALFFRAAGKKRPLQGWATGVYQGTVTLTRNQSTHDKRSHQLIID